jgi:peptidoglycan biosynthesis protein MviN/MurJ (putative lipid II flippase)
VLLSVYAPETVSLLYAHGKFGAMAVGQTSGFLRGLALVLPLLAINTLVSRLTMARQKIVPWSWFIIGSNVVSSLWTLFVIERFGASSYPAGVVVFYLWNTGVLCAYMRRQHPEISIGKALGALGQLVPATVVVAALLLCSKMLLSSWSGWIRIAIGVAVYGTSVLLFPKVFLVFPEATEALSHGSWAERVRRFLAETFG